MHVWKSIIYADRVEIHLSGHVVVVPTNRKGSNITIVFDLVVTSDEKKYVEFNYRVVPAYSGIIELYSFGIFRKIKVTVSSPFE